MGEEKCKHFNFIRNENVLLIYIPQGVYNTLYIVLQLIFINKYIY